MDLERKVKMVLLIIIIAIGAFIYSAIVFPVGFFIPAGCIIVYASYKAILLQLETRNNKKE